MQIRNKSSVLGPGRIGDILFWSCRKCACPLRVPVSSDLTPASCDTTLVKLMLTKRESYTGEDGSGKSTIRCPVRVACNEQLLGRPSCLARKNVVEIFGTLQQVTRLAPTQASTKITGTTLLPGTACISAAQSRLCDVAITPARV